MSTVSKVGHVLAKVLGIKLEEQHHRAQTRVAVTRGESVLSGLSQDDIYVEHSVTVRSFVKDYMPTKQGAIGYAKSLVPL